ncbi:MAG: TetR/AcrR family transcriptional regulator [Bacteroidales bacterium]|nr:TetR/AcrR family transcriptional regulator [Bacteroidales bacterium]MDT8430217.1 TetR/AcrR family transcriptional regulator [Bacteroidales bacterium]
MSIPKKKKQIIATGKDLFWKHGFKRVTIEEVCSEANVSKMTYYKYFSNKMELVKAIMEKTMKESMDRYKAIMNSDVPFTEKIEMQLQMKMEGTADISSEFLDDLMIHGEPEMVEYMSQMTQQVLGIVYNDYIAAQEKGEIRKDIKPEFIIYFLNHIYEMLKDENLLKMYRDPNELAMELTRFFFYGIANRPNGK